MKAKTNELGITFNEVYQNLNKQLELAYDKLHPRTTENSIKAKSGGNQKTYSRV